METLEFKNIPFNVPNNLPEFLKMRYGADFMTPRKDVTGQNRENNANNKNKDINNLQEQFNGLEVNKIPRNNPHRLNRGFTRIIPNNNSFDLFNHRINQQINEVDDRNNFIKNNDLNEEEKVEINDETRTELEEKDIERKRTAIKNFYNEMSYYVNRTRKIENQIRSNFLKRSLMHKYK